MGHMFLSDFRVRQRDYLLEISRALTEELDLNTVLRRILQAAAELLAGQAGLIGLREDEGVWQLRAHYGIPEALLPNFTPLFADIPEHGDAARFPLPELNRRLAVIAQAARWGLLQALALPMVVRGEVVGVIYIFRTYAAEFSVNDQTLLGSFATQAAIAVQNARLYLQTTQEKRRLDALLDSSPDGVFIMNPGQKVQRFNRAMTQLTGWSAAEALGRTHGDLIRWLRREPGPDLDTAAAEGWPLPGNPAPLYVEGDLLDRKGKPTPVGITYAPLFDREARLVNIIANARDITRFREAEQLKSAFISVISHELKTPVAIIKGYAETLHRADADWDKDMVNDSLTVIVEEADRLTELIENLLDASRLQAGGLSLNTSDVALAPLCARLVNKFRTQTSKHTFALAFPPEFPVVLADETRLTQVISNLLSNAIKYAPDGGTIRVGGQATPQQVTMSVSDEGPGIAPPDLPRIFDRFYRADSDLTKRVKGSGLGLFLAKAIVEAHGGRIWAESVPGQGTTVSFTLPR